MRYETTFHPGPADAREGIRLPSSHYLRKILSICATVVVGADQPPQIGAILTHRTGRGDIIGRWDIGGSPQGLPGTWTFVFSAAPSTTDVADAIISPSSDQVRAQTIAIPPEFYVGPNDSLTLQFPGAVAPPVQSGDPSTTVASIVVAQLAI